MTHRTSAFAKLFAIQAKRTLREPAAAFFMLAFAPLFTVIMGVIFGNDPRPEFGGRGYLDANLVAFSAIVIAIVGLILVPIDIVGQRASGALAASVPRRCGRSPTSRPTWRSGS